MGSIKEVLIELDGRGLRGRSMVPSRRSLQSRCSRQRPEIGAGVGELRFPGPEISGFFHRHSTSFAGCRTK